MKSAKVQFICLLLFALFGCNSQNTELQEKLYNTLENLKTASKGSIHKVNLDSLTDFDWERCFVFHADSDFDNKTIIRDTGINFKGEPLDDGSRRLVFVKDKEIVSYVDLELEAYKVFFMGGELKDNRPGDHPAQFYHAPGNLIVFKKCESDTWVFFPENDIEEFREVIESNKCK